MNEKFPASGNILETVRVFETLLSEAEKTLHCFNYQVVKILDKISDLCIDSQQWNKALEYCERSLQGYLKFYPKYHPSTALQLYRIGKYN